MTELNLIQIQQVSGGWATLCTKKHWERVIALPAVVPPKAVALVPPVVGV